jgi:hypothetical protein
MSEERHGPDCAEIVFRRATPTGGEVALEDYARAVARAGTASVLFTGDEPRRVRGVHLCGLESPLEGTAAAEDVEAFAWELAERSGGGLGWS